MENSSKALIIAGAIVLSILIIGLGMYFYNQANASSKGIKMTEYEINSVNSKFSVYEGKINANKASELLETVIAYNASVGYEGYGVIIGYKGGVSRDPNSSSVYTDESGIIAEFDEEKNGNESNRYWLFHNGESGLSNAIIGNPTNMNRSSGTLINRFMFGMSVSGISEPYYTKLKRQFSDKTHDYVGVSYYEKKTGIIRAVMVYDCQKTGGVAQ